MSADTTPEQPSVVFVRFLLDADVSPGLLSRVLQPYARRDLIPDRMWSHRAGDTMHVEIAMEAMPGRPRLRMAMPMACQAAPMAKAASLIRLRSMPSAGRSGVTTVWPRL